MKKEEGNLKDKETEKELRKKLDIRKKVKKGQKQKKLNLPNNDNEHVYGLASPPHEDIADIIYNTYGNKAEENLKKSYEAFIAEKSKVYHRPKVVPRYINPKVEEMKKKEEEKKKNNLDNDEYIEEKKDEKPLYKLKMFLNVGSKVAEGLKKFKTFKPHLVKNNGNNMNKNKKICEESNTGINKVIEEVKKDVEEKEKVEEMKEFNNIEKDVDKILANDK